MSDKKSPLGRCCICDKKVFEEELKSGTAVFIKGWPGDGYAHTDHTGVQKCYQIEVEARSGKNKKKRREMPDV